MSALLWAPFVHRLGSAERDQTEILMSKATDFVEMWMLVVYMSGRVTAQRRGPFTAR